MLGCRARRSRGRRSSVWLRGSAGQADALIKQPPLGVLRSGAEKPEEEEEALLPAEQLQALRSVT